MSKKSKRLLYLISEDWYFCTHRLPLAQAALSKGYEVFLATSISRYQAEIEAVGIKVVPLQHFNRSSNKLTQEIKILKELRTIYKNINPDVVHHVAMKPVIYGSLIAWLNKTPRIVNAFGGLGHLFTQEDFKTKIIRWVVQKILICLLNRPNTVLILQNKDDVDLLLNRHIIQPHHLVLIRGAGVNTEVFSYQEEPTIDSKQGPIVSFVARMLKDKGIIELIEAIKILQSRHVKAQFHFYGDVDVLNPSSVTSHELENWQHAGLITWHGPLKNIASIYQKSHLAVLPSYREGLPKTLLEALSCGRAVVATDVPGCREIIQHNKNGLLIPPKDPTALADAIQALLNNSKLRREMGKYGRQLIVKDFSQEKIIQQTLKLYFF